MTSSISICGIKFFNGPKECISNFEKKQWIEKAIHIANEKATAQNLGLKYAHIGHRE